MNDDPYEPPSQYGRGPAEPPPYGGAPHGGGPYESGPYGGAPYDQQGTAPYSGAPYGNGPYGAGGFAVPPAPPGYSPYPEPQNNGFAIAALVTGIAGFSCLLAPVAIGLGIAGLSMARRTGVGKAMSVAGIVLGTAWLLIYAVIVLLIITSLPSTF